MTVNNSRAEMQVKLIDYASDPLEKLYAAFRTCYSSDSPIEVWEKIRTEKISHERVREFIGERLKTGHASPLEQIVFWFAIAGVSRSLSPSVRPPSYRHQLRAAESALREVQTGSAGLRDARLVAPGRHGGGVRAACIERTSSFMRAR